MDIQGAVARIRIEMGQGWLAFPKQERPRPTRLFHYTSQSGLLGILTSNKLWATNLFYLNDSSELDYGLRLGRDIIEDMRKSGPSTCVAEFLRRGEEFLGRTTLIPGRQYFAFCFCERGDLLSQWRGYADQGGGYSIGLDTEPLTHSLIRQSLSLFPMDYGGGQNIALLKGDVQALCEALDRCVQRWPESEATLITAGLLDLRLALVFRVFWLKHPGFTEEHEWRILANYESSEPSVLQFRRGGITLVPYVELDLSQNGGLEKLPIREIICGPTLHPENAKQAVEWLTKKNGFPDVSVSVSGIPFKPQPRTL